MLLVPISTQSTACDREVYTHVVARIGVTGAGGAHTTRAYRRHRG